MRGRAARATRLGLGPAAFDALVSGMLVSGALAVFVSGVYAAVVIGLGRLLGGGDHSSLVLAIAATGAVAVAFQPLRRRLRRVAGRLVHGRRVTAQEVLSEFGRRAAAADDSLLGQVTRSLVEGTAAEGASVWASVEGRLVKAVWWPQDGDRADPDAGSWPIERDGAELGLLTLSAAPGLRLSEEDLRLAGQMASGLGLVLGNRILTGTLQRRVDELRESQHRLVAVRDETRRQLERDLHDGAQQQLVALKVKLGLARTLAERDGGLRTAASLQGLGERADRAVQAVRDFARGVYPPLLESEGLGAAVAALARRSPGWVRVQVDGIDRYETEVEATVYFCLVEALHELAARPGSSPALLQLFRVDGSLAFEVTGPACVDRPGAVPGSDELVEMADRLEAVGGGLAVEAEPGGGATIRGWVPAEAQR